MIRIYNKRRTFLLTAEDGTTHVVPPMAFDQIEEKFTRDITYRSAVAAGEIEPYETKRQGDAIERRAREGDEKKPAERKSRKGEKKADDAE